ncbi:MAG: hypothetical protein PVI06_20835 [Desulfobacterales bacterium]
MTRSDEQIKWDVIIRRHPQALAGHHVFGRVPGGCWSSPTSVYEPRYARVVCMQDGTVGIGHKRQAVFWIRAVRGGDG